MKKSHLKRIIVEQFNKLNEGKGKKKPTPSYRTAKEILTSIHEEAEAEHMDSKKSKIQQEIENINIEIQTKSSQPVTGNVDSVIADIKYLLKQKEELEKELTQMEGKLASKKQPVTDAPTEDETDPESSDEPSELDETKNPVNIINSLDQPHTPAELVYALKYAESHKDEFGNKIEAIKQKMKTPKKEELSESEIKKILQVRAGIIK